MIGSSDPGQSAPGSGGFAVFAAALRPELSRLAYLLTGHHATADDAVAGALREAAEAWSGPGQAATDGCRLALVRHALVLAEHLDRSQDDDFWRGGAWALQRLPADQRLIVALAAEPGLDAEATARLLGVPVRVARRRLRAGATALARHLKIPAAGGTAAVLDAVRVVAARHRVGAASVMPTVTAPVPAVRAADDAAGVAPGAAADDGTAGAAAAAPDPAADVTTGAPAARDAGTTPRSAVGRPAVAAVALVVAGVSLFWVLRPGSDGDVTLSSATPSASTSAAAPTTLPAPASPSATPATTSGPSPTGTSVTTTTRRAVTRSPARDATRTAGTTTTRVRTTSPTTRTRTTPPTSTTRTTRTTTTTPDLPAGLLVGRASGRCLEVPGGAGWGTQARLGDCVGGAGQTVSDGRGGSLLLAGMCLDDFNWGTAPGSLVVVWGCSGQPNQRWTVGGDGTIRSVFAPSLCIAAEGGGRGAGTRLVLLACDGGSSQVWTRT